MHPLHVAPWSILPFALLLLAIAVLPLAVGKWWHHNLNKALVSAGLAIPAVAYLFYLEYFEQQEAGVLLTHVLAEYVDFIVMLAALYTVAGGIAVQGQFRPTPLFNTGLLALGAVLANVIGTTGASMLLIRPFLRVNLIRKNHGHLPIFFIFLVSNLGGLLTPLGDPPLFLGFLNGVDFFWTFKMVPHWAVANGIVLVLALTWDAIAFLREPDRAEFPPRHGTVVIGGRINFIFLLGILGAVIAQSPAVAETFSRLLTNVLGREVDPHHLVHPWPSLIMATMGLLSWLLTKRSTREHNHFSWDAILEVAILFLGIFVTMVPALSLLRVHGPEIGVTEPWQFFWLTGLLSSVLDNAPTYLTFATLAPGQTIAATSLEHPLILQAISAGAVFMGALTYIGNGPNFMVKSIAEGMGYRMPSFFGYYGIACVCLLPVFGLVTWLFFL